MDFIDYREKLGIGYKDDEKINIFFHRIFNYLDEIASRDDTIFELPDLFSFCNSVGIHFPGDTVHELTFVFDLLKKCRSLEEFLSYYLFFVKSIPDKNETQNGCVGKRVYMNMVTDLLRSSHIPYDVIEINGDSFIFPKGAKELDDALVSQPMEWLNKYPDSRKEFVAALKLYSSATEENASDIADKFRKALERFFQEFFGGQRSLENYKSDFGKYLKDRDIPKELANTFENTLDLYCKYINNYAKHGNGVNVNTLEFIMYQTGNIIRLLCTI